ncbi:HAD hydrolase family protein [Clostridium sp. Marseille-P3244]|uniref:HAD hydrolase family protein n=1 Tax=Clostridium sp. Marseille-P3244 TaxID=1871020 RepID=UPI00093022FE|nr:HAD hydrolase family protein [Clostridium sp. Marseille-P3244]
MIKLLAVDMDGTCLDERSRMTDETLNSLRHAAAEGIVVVPTTGRNLSCIPHRLAAGILRMEGTPDDWKNPGLFRYVISSNGAVATDIRKKKTIFQAMIPRPEALRLLEACRGSRLGTASHICHRYFIQGRLLTAAGRIIYGRDAAGVYCVRDMEKIVRESRREVEEFQFYFLSAKARGKLMKSLEEFPELDGACTKLYAEVYSKEATKGNALAALAEHLGIRKEEIACIGDGENDLSMFRVSGLKIAMGNGVPELKEQADHVTGTNRHKGAAEAIKKYILS